MDFSNTGVIIVLLATCILQHLQKTRLKKQIGYLSDTMKNVKDIVYYGEMKPSLKYKYLSPTINQLGCNIWSEHMEKPEKIFEILHPDDHEKMHQKLKGEYDFSTPFIVRLKNDEGRYIWFEEYATPIYKDGECVAIQGVYRDIDDKVRLEQELHYKLTHDVLTNTYNRTYFQSQMNHYNDVENVSMGIIVCDLDELKLVNDKFGHLQGDQLIIEAANILMESISSDLIIARIGGDEFAIIMPNVREYEIEEFISCIYQNNNKHNQRNSKFKVKFSTGYAYVDSSIGNMEYLLSEADQKMYDSKRAGKVLIRIHNKEEVVAELN